MMAYNCSGNIFAIKGEKLVVADSLSGYIIADAGDVLLICPKDKEQSIKDKVTDVRTRFGEKFL